MMRERKKKGTLFVVGFLGLALVLSFPAQASAAAVSWTSTSFDVSGDSRLGSIGNYNSYPPYPDPTNNNLGSAPYSTSGGSLPVADGSSLGPVYPFGFCCWDRRYASSNGGVAGNIAGTITMSNNATAYTYNDTGFNSWRSAQGKGTTTFMGDFVSTGTTLDLNFDGTYQFFAFLAQSIGLSAGLQSSIQNLNASLLVEDLTAASTLFNTSIWSAQATGPPCCTTINVSGVPFSGLESIDLTGTLGHTIQVTLFTLANSRAFAGINQFATHTGCCPDRALHPTGASGSAGFEALNLTFTTTGGEAGAGDPVPEPATLLLLGTGLAGLGIIRRRRKI